MKAIVLLLVAFMGLAAAAPAPDPKPSFLAAPLVAAPLAYSTSYQYRSPYYAYPSYPYSAVSPYAYGYASAYPYGVYPAYSSYSYVY